MEIGNTREWDYGYIKVSNRWYIDEGGYWARSGDVTVNIQATATTVKIKIPRVVTSFRSGKIEYSATS